MVIKSIENIIATPQTKKTNNQIDRIKEALSIEQQAFERALKTQPTPTPSVTQKTLKNTKIQKEPTSAYVTKLMKDLRTKQA